MRRRIRGSGGGQVAIEHVDGNGNNIFGLHRHLNQTQLAGFGMPAINADFFSGPPGNSS